MLNRSALKPIIKIKAYDHVTEEFHNRMLYLFVCVSNKIVRKCNYKMSYTQLKSKIAEVQSLCTIDLS